MGTYSPFVPDYKNDWAPDPTRDTQTLTAQLKLDKDSSNPILLMGFVPSVATSVSLLFYGSQSGEFGAMSRVNNEPQCDYSLNPSTPYGQLPWKTDVCSMEGMWEEDCQKNNTGGEIVVLNSSAVNGTKSKYGDWIFVNLVKYGSDKEVTLAQLTVNVDTASYTEWYKCVPWNGNQPPDAEPGPTGGSCEPEWSE